MIFIFDNGEVFSNHALYFVEAAADFGVWFNSVYRPWIDGIEYRPLMIVATTPAVERRERWPYKPRPLDKFDMSIEDDPMHEFSTMPVVDFLAKIVVQERDGKPRPRYRVEIENVCPAGENPGGMKQVTATCEKCGGPGITTKENLEARGGKMIHKDPAICANVRRNTGSR
jgi:hypothetical protein